MGAFLKVVAAVARSAVLAEYQEHPGLLARLPNYRVRMGFGLHLGSAIEGAIGSEFKIDASYLSPNVNMASRLEAATKQYGATILISHWLIETCSVQMKNCCRQIDYVTVKGSKQPIRLYTCDMDDRCLAVSDRWEGRITRRQKFEVRQLRELKKRKRLSYEYVPIEDLHSCEDIHRMRSKCTRD